MASTTDLVVNVVLPPGAVQEMTAGMLTSLAEELRRQADVLEQRATDLRAEAERA
jgi:hypothetical protein